MYETQAVVQEITAKYIYFFKVRNLIFNHTLSDHNFDLQ